MKTSTILFSAAMLFATGVNAQQYCILPGRNSYDPQQPGITEFKLSSIDRVSLPVEGPLTVPSLVVTGDSTILTRGKTYTLTIQHSKDPVNFPDATNNIRVWIDYNHNYSFTDATETVITNDFETPGIFTATFTVPANAPLGKTRLRATAKMSTDTGHTLPTSCDEPKDPLGYHGEMEDYNVIIQAPAGIENTTDDDLNVSVYPNPVSNNITVSLNAAGNPAVSIELYDMTGKMIATLYNGKASTNNTYSFNLSSYATVTGIYFIKVKAGDIAQYQKLVKAN